jgi:hypothetical protein
VAWDVLTGERIGVQDVEGVSKPSPGRDADTPTPTAPFFVY